MTISQNLKDFCLDKNISIKQLAKEIKVQDSLLYKYINDSAIPTLRNIIKLANYFDCSIDYLLGLSDYPNKEKINKEFGCFDFYSRYKKLLSVNNLTHYALCKELDLSMASLTSWKNGTIPYLDTLIKIANYFGVSVDYLVGRSDCEF